MSQRLSVMGLWNSYNEKYPGKSKLISGLTLTYPIESVLNPIIFAAFVKNVGINNKSGMMKNLILFSILNVIYMGVYNLDMYLTEDMNVTIHNHIIEEVITYLFDVKKQNIETLHNGELISKIKMFAQMMTDYINNLRNTIIPNLLSLFFQSIYLLSIDVILASLIIGMLIVILTVLKNSNKYCSDKSSNSINSESNLYEQVDEILLNFSTIANHNGYNRELKNIIKKGEENTKTTHQTVNCSMKSTSIMNIIISILSIIFIIRLYSKFSHKSPKNISNATASVTVLMEAFNTSKYFIYSIYSISHDKSSLDVLQQYFKSLKPVLNRNSVNSPPSYSKEALVIKNLSFSYSEDVPIIKDFSTSISEGSKIAIVGPNGTGKSTLLKILIQYIIPTSGYIYVFGHEYNDISSEQVRNIIGYASQDCVLFDNSIKYNLLYANPDMSSDELEYKINEFGLTEFFSTFEQGLNTSVGKQGSQLSGGQKQIIQLVRILLQNPPIIILDEITAAVDEKHTKIIVKLVKNLKNKTVLFTTHDKDLLKYADKIIDMSK